MHLSTLNLLDTPLEGVRLIEASAGTGKTYTIAGLFVRLVVEQALTVDRILVVTYTRAATEELNGRIRTRLTEARQAFCTGSSADPFLAGLVERAADRRQACRNLDQAVRDFDRACIFTIHGFCQRLLSEHAFETGAPFEFELLPDPANLRREVAEDYWRRHFYDAPAEVVAYATRQAGVGGPEHYRRLIDRPRHASLKILPEPGPLTLELLTPYRHAYRRLVSAWTPVRSAVLELLCDPALNGRLYGAVPEKRRLAVAALAEAMDRFVASGQVGFPLFEGFGKFTAGGLEAATRKGCHTPRHHFFSRCQELKDAADLLSGEIRQYLRDLDIRFFEFAETELLRRKQIDNVLFYDDLLLAVRNALTAGNDWLPGEVRKRFKAALVDEFQDTDPIQCEIFLHLFSAPDSLLFLIGDPKQSIYSFRGSDIFSYLEAARQAQRTDTLRRNWRSQPALIQAVNAVFTHAPRPFLYRAIGFEATRPGRGRIAQTAVAPAMDLWYFPGTPARPMSKTDAVPRITAAVADEILRRVQETNHPGEIAVLVRSNRQGHQMKAALDTRGVPAVLRGAGNVFETREATELQRVLTGVCEHNREDGFRSALITEMLGVTAGQLDDADAGVSTWEARRARFREYAALWNRSGFMPMFRWLMAREQVMERLLGFFDGERRLTNLWHLGELLQEESLRRPSMTGLIRWLSDQRTAASSQQEEQLLRLESDARAVNILTIHRSKGLEFPIVFCPFTWDGSLLRSTDEVVCHESAGNGTILDLGSDQFEKHRRMAQQELLAENLRLLYVAVTRARNHCYLVWGRFNTAETAAPAYLFHHPPETAAGQDVVEALQAHVSGLDDDARLRDLNRLVTRAAGTIALTVQTGEPSPQRLEPVPTTDAPQCRAFKGRIDRSWKVTSYSALVSRSPVEEERPDYDRTTGASAAADIQEAREGGTPAAARAIDRFPTGARAGIFFHDLLEQAPFGRPIPEELVLAKLREYNYDAQWQPTVTRVLHRVLAAELMPGLRLHSVGRQQRIHEMEFYVPLQDLRPPKLQVIFEDIGVKIPESYIIEMNSLTFAPLRGFLKGYVDLVFEHHGRYYLLDWKSNHLGNGQQWYRPAALAEVMTAERYVLQYLLYTVAVDRYLRTRDSAYRYREHFGGVFYLFLRGISEDDADRSGIFYDRPAPEAIEALSKTLLAT